jgi:hypothetical protein
MSLPRVSRPGSVTVVVVLTWISAVLEILAGVMLLVLAGVAKADGASDISFGTVLLFGIVVLLIGVITAAVASRLGKGGNGARMIITVLEVLQVAGAITALITLSRSATLDSSPVVSQSIATIIIGVLILVLLWNQRANEFFASR